MPTLNKYVPATQALSRTIALDDVMVPADRMRALRPELVDELAESISRQGQLQAIVVVRMDDGYQLIAGWQRLEAARKLGRETILANILEGLDADHALLAEIDENLIRADLTPAERAMHVGRRKELYEKAHPETRKGATGRGRSKQSQVGTSKEPAPAFIDDTAKKTGKGRTTIAREVHRAGIPKLADVVGTSLDKGEQLDALAKLPERKQQDLIERAKGGEVVTAKPRAELPTKVEKATASDWKSLSAIVQHEWRAAVQAFEILTRHTVAQIANAISSENRKAAANLASEFANFFEDLAIALKPIVEPTSETPKLVREEDAHPMPGARLEQVAAPESRPSSSTTAAPPDESLDIPAFLRRTLAPATSSDSPPAPELPEGHSDKPVDAS